MWGYVTQASKIGYTNPLYHIALPTQNLWRHTVGLSCEWHRDLLYSLSAVQRHITNLTTCRARDSLDISWLPVITVSWAYAYLSAAFEWRPPSWHWQLFVTSCINIHELVCLCSLPDAAFISLYYVCGLCKQEWRTIDFHYKCKCLK